MSHRPSSSAHSSPAGSPPGSPGSYSSQERLILVPDDQFESDALLGLWPDEEEAPTPTTERSHSISSLPSTNAPALPPRAIIPLLIGPCIKLGTTYIPRAVEIAGPIPALVGLVGMALLSAFTGQVWVLLGRYVSRWTIEEIVAEAMIRNPGRRGSSKDKWKRRIRKGVRGLVCVTALLLCAMYLHESAHLLQPAIPMETSYASQAGTTVILAAILMPLVSATSLATRKVLWSNFLSIVLQLVIAIVGAVHYFHEEDEERHTHTRRGLSKLTESHTQAGTWEAISIMSFAFANQLLTLPLYSALVTNFAAKPTFAPRARTRRMITSFPVLLLVSTVVSIALTLPLILAPLTRHAAPPNPSDVPTVLRAPIRETLSRTLEAAIPTIQAFALILTIPPLFAGVIVPRVRQRSYRWVLFLLAAAVAAVIPGRKASLTSLSMTLSLLTCYVLPAILHAVFHGLRRPRSILFSGPNAPLTSSEPATASSSSPDPEALLRHKERSLQRRRLARRVLWDVGVWVVLGPVGIAATVWTAGRAIGVW